MAFDGLMTKAVLYEICGSVTGAKIEKITQPEPDRVVMQLRGASERVRLLLDISSQGSRLQLTKLDFENPDVPPAFCMLLRKHIQGGRITGIRQHGMERIVEFDIQTVNEMGYSVNKRLIAEIMGKHSNLILTDAQSGKVIDSLKRISIDVSRVRQILPGIIYEYPPVSNLANSSGFAPSTQTAIENGAVIPDYSCLSSADQKNSGDERIRSFVYLDDQNIPRDFHSFRMPQYDGSYKELEFDSLCDAMDYYYSHRFSTNRIMQKADNLSRHIAGLLDKALLKKQRLSEEIRKADNADIYRLKGELLTANISSVRPGARSVKVISYYDGAEITIELDEKISAAKNAQNYYKKYAKLRSSKKEKLAQLEECERDIDYLGSVQAMVMSAKTSEELDSLREELAEQGFARQKTIEKKKKKVRPQPRRYKLSSGLEVLVGRNNTENDYITFKLGQKTDWWFHTKDIHGSHVLLVCNGTDPSPEDMYGAAAIAAWFSKARDSQNVPVDYAPVRHVKKPAGAKPGMVIFTNNGTVWIDPKDPENDP